MISIRECFKNLTFESNLNIQISVFFVILSLLNPLNFEDLDVGVVPYRGVRVPQVDNPPHVRPASNVIKLCSCSIYNLGLVCLTTGLKKLVCLTPDFSKRVCLTTDLSKPVCFTPDLSRLVCLTPDLSNIVCLTIDLSKLVCLTLMRTLCQWLHR